MALVPHTFKREWQTHKDGPCSESLSTPAARLLLPWSDDGRSQRGAITMALPAATGANRKQIEGGHEFQLPREVLGIASKCTWTRTTKGVKLGAILDKCPTVDHLDFDLAMPTGAKAFYQGELTREEVEEGCVRPEDVVGSYALYGGRYHDKLSHVYRPYCCPVAKPEERAWCRMELLPDGRTLRVYLPLDWLGAQKQWPILLDPTLGGEGTGATSGYSIGALEMHAFRLGTMPAAGTLSSLHIYDGDTSNVVHSYGGVYSDTDGVPNARLFKSAETDFTGDGWHVFSAGGEALASGLVVYGAVACESSSDWRLYFDATTSWWRGKKAGYDIPSPAPAEWDTTATDRDESAYITYVESGAAPTYRRRVIIAGLGGMVWAQRRNMTRREFVKSGVAAITAGV